MHMFALLFVALPLVAACTSTSAPETGVCSVREDTGSFPLGGPAFVHLHAGAEGSWISAVFTEERPPVHWSNYSAGTFVSCVLDREALCSAELPSEADELPVPVLPATFGRDDLTTTFHGDTIEVAGLDVPFVRDGNVGYYHLDLADGEALPLGTFGASWSGDWDYSGELGTTQAPMEITSPVAGASVAADPSGVVAVEWIPNITGLLTLRVNTGVGATLYRLEDDTWFEVDLADVPGDLGGAEVTLTHWQRFGAYHQGHSISVTVTSDTGFALQ